jgi:DDB1- and CUL4-associated factor 5
MTNRFSFTISKSNNRKFVVTSGSSDDRFTYSNHSDELVDVFLESSPINCLAVQPEETQTFIAATDDGHIHLYDLRTSSSTTRHDQPSIIVAESFDGSYHSCAFHPQQTCLVATANARQGIELYDIRLAKR